MGIQKKLVLVKNKKEIEDYIDLNILPKKLGGNNPNGANQSEMFLRFKILSTLYLPRKSSTPTRQTITKSKDKIKMYILYECWKKFSGIRQSKLIQTLR